MNTSEILSGVPSEKRAQAETFLKHREAVSVPFWCGLCCLSAR